MDMHQHGMVELFQQLGLGSSPQEMKSFINEHRHKRDSVPLHEASFWTSSQATFLKQAIEEDADWAELVDHLDVILRD